MIAPKGSFFTKSELPNANDTIWSSLPSRLDVANAIDDCRRSRACYAIAEFETGGLTADELQSKLNALGMSAEELLGDPKCVALIERLSAQPELVAQGASRQAIRIMRSGLSHMEEELQSPNLSGAQLRDHLETASRIKSQLAKQPPEKEQVRKLDFMIGVAVIDTPAGHNELRINNLDDVVEAIRLMRCTDRDEVETVVDFVRKLSPMFFSGSLTLRGW